MIADKACYERGCACYDPRVDSDGVEVVEKREWVGLTDEEVIKCTPTWGGTVEDVARAVEAKLKEKNT